MVVRARGRLGVVDPASRTAAHDAAARLERSAGRGCRAHWWDSRDVASCCNPRGCDRMFTDRFARRTAKRYRKRGLDRTARRIVELIEQQGLDGATVLEVGGGVGSLQVELLKRGAARATNLELSPAYEEEARQLLAETGLTERVDRHIVDIAAAPDEVQPEDIVVLHRVVCCYPDYAKLLGAAASHARHHVVFSYPPRNAASRLFIGASNLAFRLGRSDFRVFAHPPTAMLAVLTEHGLHPVARRRGSVWNITAARRHPPTEPPHRR
jgi:2-polyprenyl-3-methyl-5-hydroxy-6-metoxy-1,4-benzoquinol methylase